MANPSLQIGNEKWAIKEDNLLGYSTAGTRFVPESITMTRASAGTRVNPQGLIETVELLGSELVVNGDFTTDSNWTKGTGWSIANGKATSAGSNYGGQLKQTILSTNKIYLLTFDIVDYTSGKLSLESSYYGTTQLFEGAGSYSAYFTSLSQTELRLYSQNLIGSIDNVSVKESTKNNLARVDYDGTASSLLAEPQRTNLLHYSEDFADTYWSSNTDVETPVKSTTIKSPDGNYNAWHIVKDGNNSKIAKVIGSSSVEYSKSIWARTISGSGTAYFGNGSIASGVLTTVTTEWQRIEITSSAINFYAVDFRGSSTLTEVLIWGSQMEEGSYPTSYIPTSGSSVTRVQETYSKTGISNLINSTEGVLFLEMAALQTTNTNSEYLAISNGTYSANSIMIQLRNGTNQFAVWAYSGGVNQIAEIITLTDITDFNKIAIKWKLNDFEVFVNGSSVYSKSTYTAPTGLDRLEFSRNGTAHFFGKVKQLQVFKTALTDTELATLTT